MGIMLENVSPRLGYKGQVHYGSPDKDPAVRLQTLEDCGQASVPFTTGILIGIGETREEIIEGMEENLCRCGSYMRIIDAIQTAGKEMKGGM